MQLVFVDPITKRVLERDLEGKLFCLNGNQRQSYPSYEGCYDFAMANPDVKRTRDAYDEAYAKWRTANLTVDSTTEPWLDTTVPWRKTMLESLGRLSGRTVLLLGNGSSYKEFHFLNLGARVVFTDLSIVAVRQAQSAFAKSALYANYVDRIEFHAVDALHLPFADETFDVVYGAKFVGFLRDLPQFLSEVKRCLKPGGRCRFSDDAYAPAWERVKRFVVNPAKAILRRRSTLPVEKVRSESSSGFRKEDFELMNERIGFSRLVFVTEYFFVRIAQLFVGNLTGWNPDRLRNARPLFHLMIWFDKKLANSRWMRRNHLALTWGFDK